MTYILYILRMPFREMNLGSCTWFARPLVTRNYWMQKGKFGVYLAYFWLWLWWNWMCWGIYDVEACSRLSITEGIFRIIYECIFAKIVGIAQNPVIKNSCDLANQQVRRALFGEIAPAESWYAEMIAFLGRIWIIFEYYACRVQQTICSIRPK